MASAESVSGVAPKTKFSSICVFSGSSLGTDYEFVKAAIELGKTFAARNIGLVFNGELSGLAGCVATHAMVGGSPVWSILLKNPQEKGMCSYSLGNEIKVSSAHERFMCMFGSAEAFIALPGGLEALEGIANVVFWAKLNPQTLIKKPVGLLNINGF